MTVFIVYFDALIANTAAISVTVFALFVILFRKRYRDAMRQTARLPTSALRDFRYPTDFLYCAYIRAAYAPPRSYLR